MKNILQGIFVTLFGIVFALVLVEIIFRVFSSFTPVRKTWNDRPPFYFKDEEAATIQDFAYSATKPENTFRIAVVGDSYTFAPYMQFTDTFPRKMAEMLNLNKTELKAEVINYGVPAYSTTHEVSVTEKALKEQADLVLLQITLNDPELKPYRPKEINTDQPDRFGEKVFEGRMETVVKYWRSLGYFLTRVHNQKTHTAYKEYFIDLFTKKRPWNSFQDAFTQIKNECLKANKKLVVVVFPLFGLPLDESYPFFVIHDQLRQYFTEQGVDFLDLYSAYEGIPLDRMQVVPGVDRHPNEIAHRIAAEQIYIWLAEKNFIPDELKIRNKYTERMGITGKGFIKP